MATTAVTGLARTSRGKPGTYCIRLKISPTAREDAWELCRVVGHYGGVEICDCCFLFANEEQRSAASEALRFRFGAGFFEETEATFSTSSSQRFS